MKTVIVSANPLFGEVIRESAKECLCGELIDLEPNIDPDQLSIMDPDIIILDESISMDTKEVMFSAACHLAKCRILIVNLFNNDFVILDSTRSTIQKVNDLKNALTIETEKHELEIEMLDDPAIGPMVVGGENEVIEDGNQTDEPKS